MKRIVKTKHVLPLIEVARRYSMTPEYAVFAASYVALLAVRQGKTFPLPELGTLLKTVHALPDYVSAFLKDQLADHWDEYRRVAGSFDEDSLVDFFGNEAVAMLMESRDDCSPLQIVDSLCIGLLGIAKGDRVADLNCGIGKFILRSWFALWSASGSDKGLSVTGYSRMSEYAAMSYITCGVAEANVNLVNASMFEPTKRRFDKIVLIPPFGMETRALNIPLAQASLKERFDRFPEIRLGSADWVFAARAASLLADGGRAVVAVPENALNGGLSQVYREFFVREGLIEAVISIPKGFLNGTQMGFALVVLHSGMREVKFVKGENYLKSIDGAQTLDVATLVRDYRDLNDYESVTTKSLERIYENDCNLTPDYYLGDDLIYNGARPLGDLVRGIRRGAKLPAQEWKAYGSEGPVAKVSLRHLNDGLLDVYLPRLSRVPEEAAEAVVEDGDLLVSRMGVPFKIAVADIPDGMSLVADENVWIVRMGGNRMLAYYLRAYLESPRGGAWLSRLSAGAVYRTISAKNLAKIPIPEVDHERRTAIAEKLENTTAVVRENRKRLDDSLAAMKNVWGELGIRN